MPSFYGRTGIDITNTLSENLEHLASRVRGVAIEAVLAGAEPIKQAAYDNANVSRGILGHGVNGEHMRDEIKVTVTESGNVISGRVQIDMGIIPYAAHQEFGPRGNAFMRRAFDEKRDEAHKIMGSVFSAALGSDGKVRTQVRFRRYA